MGWQRRKSVLILVFGNTNKILDATADVVSEGFLDFVFARIVGQFTVLRSNSRSVLFTGGSERVFFDLDVSLSSVREFHKTANVF